MGNLTHTFSSFALESMEVLAGESGPGGQVADKESEILQAEFHQSMEISPLPSAGRE